MMNITKSGNITHIEHKEGGAGFGFNLWLKYKILPVGWYIRFPKGDGFIRFSYFTKWFML